MRCTQCKAKMKCLDTREQDDNRTKRKWVCYSCDLQGYSYEHWNGRLTKRNRYKEVVDVGTDRLMKQLGVQKPEEPKPAKKRKEVVRKQRARESVEPSVFEDMEEDYAPDLSDLGLDIPRQDDW